MNILLGVTGSVAACLTPKLVRALAELGNVRVVFTDKGSAMFGNESWPTDIEPFPEGFYDSDEWPKGNPWQKGDPVLHIDLKNWADVLVIAPLSANTLAKMANGLADNLLTSIVRAWPVWKPLFVAPAMNTDMWDKPVTRRHLNQLREDFSDFLCVYPQTKVLACGDTGIGAMAGIPAIVVGIRHALRWSSPLQRTSFAGRVESMFVPEAPHLGAFGSVRKHDVHTGVDLYTFDGDAVLAVESGVVVDVVDFTGSKVSDQDGNPMSWWNDTQAVLVKGPSGVVVYGEISPMAYLKVGSLVTRGSMIGTVKAVLPPHKLRKDIPHHSTAMLHIELYESVAAEKNFRWGKWEVGGPRPEGLLDPTPFLKEIH